MLFATFVVCSRPRVGRLEVEGLTGASAATFASADNAPRRREHQRVVSGREREAREKLRRTHAVALCSRPCPGTGALSSVCPTARASRADGQTQAHTAHTRIAHTKMCTRGHTCSHEHTNAHAPSVPPDTHTQTQARPLHADTQPHTHKHAGTPPSACTHPQPHRRAHLLLADEQVRRPRVVPGDHDVVVEVGDVQSSPRLFQWGATGGNEATSASVSGTANRAARRSALFNSAKNEGFYLRGGTCRGRMLRESASGRPAMTRADAQCFHPRPTVIYHPIRGTDEALVPLARLERSTQNQTSTQAAHPEAGHAGDVANASLVPVS